MMCVALVDANYTAGRGFSKNREDAARDQSQLAAAKGAEDGDRRSEVPFHEHQSTFSQSVSQD